MQQVRSVLKGKKYFVFDLDETLIESYVSHKQGIYNLSKKISLKNPLPYQKILDFLDKDGRHKEKRYEAYSLFLGFEQAKTSEKFHEYCDKVYWQGVGSAIGFLPYSLELLKSISNAGGCISIVTNGGLVQHQKINLLKNELLKDSVFIDVYEVTGDYIDCDKPNPHCLEKVFRFYQRTVGLNIDLSDFVYIGNEAYRDGEMAKSMGIDFVLLDQNECAEDYEGYVAYSLKDLYED